jgi:hypothetical protein
VISTPSVTKHKRSTDGTFVGKRRTRGCNKPKEFVVNDERITLISFGQACAQLGVSKKALRRYEDEQIVPINHHFDDQGRRWYHPEFVAFLTPLLREQAKKREPLWSLKTRVEQAWQEATTAGLIPLISRKTQEPE